MLGSDTNPTYTSNLTLNYSFIFPLLLSLLPLFKKNLKVEDADKDIMREHISVVRFQDRGKKTGLRPIKSFTEKMQIN